MGDGQGVFKQPRPALQLPETPENPARKRQEPTPLDAISREMPRNERIMERRLYTRRLSMRRVLPSQAATSTMSSASRSVAGCKSTTLQISR